MLTRRGEVVLIFLLTFGALVGIFAVEGYYKSRKLDDEKAPVKELPVQTVDDFERDCWIPEETEFRKRMKKYDGGFKP